MNLEDAEKLRPWDRVKDMVTGGEGTVHRVELSRSVMPRAEETHETQIFPYVVWDRSGKHGPPQLVTLWSIERVPAREPAPDLPADLRDALQHLTFCDAGPGQGIPLRSYRRLEARGLCVVTMLAPRRWKAVINAAGRQALSGGA